MKRIAKFHKVSLEQFKKDWIDTFGLDEEANIEGFMKISNCQEERLQVLQGMISLLRYV